MSQSGQVMSGALIKQVPRQIMFLRANQRIKDGKEEHRTPPRRRRREISLSGIPRCCRTSIGYGHAMTLKAMSHEPEEGGFWVEVPPLPDCFTQVETLKTGAAGTGFPPP